MVDRIFNKNLLEDFILSQYRFECLLVELFYVKQRLKFKPELDRSFGATQTSNQLKTNRTKIRLVWI